MKILKFKNYIKENKLIETESDPQKKPEIKKTKKVFKIPGWVNY